MKKWLRVLACECRWILCPVLCSLLVASALRVTAQQYFTAEKTYGIKLGKTKPLHNYYAIPPTDPAKLKESKRNKPKVVPNFIGRRPMDFNNPNAQPIGPDPLWQAGSSRMTMHSILPTLNFEGINENNSGSIPPDVNGDVGMNYYVEIVNATSFRVYNKNGQAVSLLLSANTIWNQVGQSSFGDPILLYDQTVDRWLLTEFAPVNRRRVLLAISENGDPRGSWTAYEFQTPSFPDFPKYGIWPESYFLTANEDGFNFPVYAFNREDMLAGADTVNMQRLTVPKIFGVFFEVGQPVDWDGLNSPPPGSPGLVVKLNDDGWLTTPQDVIQLLKINIDWTNAANSNIESVNIPCTPYDTDGCQLETTGGFSCVPQPNGQGIDGAEWIINNKAMYRNLGTHESFVMCFMVDVTGADVAGIRWIEFRKTPDADWYIYQEGTVGSDDGIHRFMPSIGIDGHGTIGLAYAVSGFNKHPSLRYTGRYSYDPPGVMTFQEYEFATGQGSQGQDRFGDYFSMSVDPADDATFWFVGQYITANSSWNSRIVAFRASRDTFDIAPFDVITPVTSDELTDESITVAIRNQGLKTVGGFSVAFQFNGGPWITEQAVIDTLAADSIYYHTFDSTLQFTTFGPYPIRIATDFNIDQHRNNDTLEAIVALLPHRDLVLEYLPPVPEVTICGEQAEAEVLLRNIGGDTLHTALLALRINNGTPVVYPWSGVLATGEESIFSFLVTGLQEGSNQITLNVVSVNNDIDEIPDNNEIAWEIDARLGGEFVTLEFKTDNFPSENSWKLFDDDGMLLASEGPFAEAQHVYTNTFCISSDACYTFTVYDVVGDGMDSGVDGDFTITDIEGNVLAAIGDPDFDEETSSRFCVSDSCMLDVDVAVSHVTIPGATDGVVFVSPSNDIGNTLYSIDGGDTFITAAMFDDLGVGLYEVIVRDEAGCTDSITFEVKACQLQMQLTGLPANPGDIGEIHVAVNGGNGAIQYSLNGAAYQADSFFVMLEPGIYFVSVRDSIGCEASDTIMISTVGTRVIANNYFVRISPNPGTVSFHIAAALPTDDVFVPYVILNAVGEIVQHSSVVRYDDTYRDQFYMVTYPPGMYFVIFGLSQGRIAERFIKL